MPSLLSRIESPADLRLLTDDELTQLAREIREELCRALQLRSAHFASNLGVVELCLALHLTFDFSKDRLIWDTGHQIYPHKLVTGRYSEFSTIRTRDGLMGYPNPEESDYDLFMTGHAGCSISSVLGMKIGDCLQGRKTKSVAVIGDGAFPSGIVFEAMNNAAGLGKDLLVVLNDNQMSICPRVGGLAQTLDKARMTPAFSDAKRQIEELLQRLPVVGNSMDRLWTSLKDSVKAAVFGGMLFEELGFHYVGPIDGHDLPTLRDYLRGVQDYRGPVLLHVLTQKGRGIECAQKDPVKFHTPPQFERVENGVISLKSASSKSYSNVVSDAIYQAMAQDARVCVLTAAMCQGNKLERVRHDFPDRFFDTGICESHAVAFAAGLAKSGLKPIVAIYSTFLQRSFDQIFQEVVLQNLPVVFCMDRAGFTGPDGPTHHGSFDIAYMRLFPNMTVMAPGDETDIAPMLQFALHQPGPVSMRYPKEQPLRIPRDLAPVEMGQAEICEWGTDGCLIAFGTLLAEATTAANRLRDRGYDVGVINARFAKPLDKSTILRAVEQLPFVVAVEEGTIMGGFGSAVLEAANEAGVRSDHVVRCAIPDRWVMHAERFEQLREVELDAAGIEAAALSAAHQFDVAPSLATLEHGKRVG